MRIDEATIIGNLPAFDVLEAGLGIGHQADEQATVGERIFSHDSEDAHGGIVTVFLQVEHAELVDRKGGVRFEVG